MHNNNPCIRGPPHRSITLLPGRVLISYREMSFAILKWGTGPLRSVLGGTVINDVTNRFVDWLSAFGIECAEREVEIL